MAPTSPRYRYQPLRNDHNDAVAQRPRGPRARRLAFCLIIAFVSLVIGLFVATWGELPQLSFLHSCHDRSDGYQCQPEISHSWGQYSPFFSVPSELSRDIPDGCELTFAQVLARHGSRDPTRGRGATMEALIKRLQASIENFQGPYAFLNSFEYSLGVDELSTFGQSELRRAGAAFYRRYRVLMNSTEPFLRASGQHRVVESAENFARGLYNAAEADGSGIAHSYPWPIVTIPEGELENNTLDNELCRAAKQEPLSSLKGKMQKQWMDIFAAPILKRLHADLPGTNLTAADAIVLMDMCPFTTVASPDVALTPFCALFTEEEWRGYDYYQSLGKYHGHGTGHPLGATRGIGFVNELVSRLTHTPVVDHTSVNHTLDASPITFPIDPKHNLFADFSHDNTILGVYAALGLYNDTPTLDPRNITSPHANGGFSASWVVPFASRMYVEKMRCRISTPFAKDGPPIAAGPVDSSTHAELVRILVNDRVIPLSGCGADALGRCQLDRFLDSLRFTRSGGRWKECFQDYETV